MLSTRLYLGLPSGLFPMTFLPKIHTRSSSHPFAPLEPPHHFPRLFHSNYNWRMWKSLSCSLCTSVHPPVTSSVFGQNILLSDLVSNTLSLGSSRKVRDQVSYLYRTSGKIIFLFLSYLKSNEKTKVYGLNCYKNCQNPITSLCTP
jgi:hypothetical protein